MSKNLYDENILGKIQDITLVFYLYIRSLLKTFKNQTLSETTATYCTFIGYSKSGKTFLSSLLDAHPNMVFANELPILRYIYLKFSRQQIFNLILDNSSTFTEVGRKSRGYSYIVPNQWQGRFNHQLKVIGDENGEGTTLRLRGRLWMLGRLYQTMGINTKFIHVVRNPFDNISYMSMVNKSKFINKFTLKECIDYYFDLCKTVLKIKNVIDDDSLFEIRYECFVEKPRYHLKNICIFLGLNAPDDYLNDCASIVFENPVASRYDVNWNRELIDIVHNKIDNFPFLKGYTYDN